MCKKFTIPLTKISTSDIATMLPRAAFQSRPNRQLYNSPLTLMPSISSIPLHNPYRRDTAAQPLTKPITFQLTQKVTFLSCF